MNEDHPAYDRSLGCVEGDEPEERQPETEQELTQLVNRGGLTIDEARVLYPELCSPAILAECWLHQQREEAKRKREAEQAAAKAAEKRETQMDTEKNFGFEWGDNPRNIHQQLMQAHGFDIGAALRADRAAGGRVKPSAAAAAQASPRQLDQEMEDAYQEIHAGSASPQMSKMMQSMNRKPAAGPWG